MAFSIQRRNFLKRSAIAAGSAGLAAMAPQALLAAAQSQPQSTGEIESTLETDVLVLGAGAAGAPAAIAAARTGAKVILLEEDAVVGGAPVDMYVSMICFNPRVGIFREMINELYANYTMSGVPVTTPEQERKDNWFLPSSYQRVIVKLLSAEKNLQVICGARAAAPMVSDAGARKRFEGVLVRRPNGKYLAVKAKVTIDATGSGEICELAGATAMYGHDAKSDFNEPHAHDVRDDKVMPCTWMFISQKMRNGAKLDFDKLKGKGMVDSGFGWYKSNPAECDKRDSGIYLHWGCVVLCKNTRDPIALADAQAQGLAKMERDIAVLAEQGYGVNLAPRIGVRECRRIMGDHVLSENDLKAGKFYDDTLAAGDSYLDAWGDKLTEEEKRCPTYGIPFRSLVVKDFEGLMTAGKIISGTHLAMTSYRQQCIMASVGQGAGVTAALAATNATNVRDIDIKDAQARLEKMGVPIRKYFK